MGIHHPQHASLAPPAFIPAQRSPLSLWQTAAAGHFQTSLLTRPQTYTWHHQDSDAQHSQGEHPQHTTKPRCESIRPSQTSSPTVGSKPWDQEDERLRGQISITAPLTDCEQTIFRRCPRYRQQLTHRRYCSCTTFASLLG